MVPSALTVTAPLAGVVVDDTVSVLLSGSLSLLRTVIVTGIPAKVDAESLPATGGWLQDGSFAASTVTVVNSLLVAFWLSTTWRPRL